MMELQRAVEHHVQEEETEALPEMQRTLGEDRMQNIGQKFMTAKQEATRERRLEALIEDSANERFIKPYRYGRSGRTADGRRSDRL